MRLTTTQYLTRVRALRKALPEIKLPKPDSPSNKAIISKLHNELLGGVRRLHKTEIRRDERNRIVQVRKVIKTIHSTGRLNLEHQIIRAKNKNDARKLSEVFGVPIRERLPNIIIVKQKGKYTIKKNGVQYQKGNLKAFYPFNTKIKTRDDINRAISNLIAQRQPNQIAIIQMGASQRKGEFEALELLSDEIDALFETYEEDGILPADKEIELLLFEPVNQINGRTFGELRSAKT